MRKAGSMWRMKDKKGIRKMSRYGYIPAVGIMLAVLGLMLFEPFRAGTAKAAEDVIYAAGMPDAWPLEYYEHKGKTYKGILPELLEEAAQGAGVSIRYVEPSGKDSRLSLAGNAQVDAVWTYGLSDEEIKEAGLVPGSFSLSFSENGERQEIRLAFSKSMPEKWKDLLEAQLERVDQEEISSAVLAYAREGYETNTLSSLYKYVIPGCLAAAGVVLLAMPFILSKRKRQIEALAYRDDVTQKDNFAVWKRKYTERIQDGNREHYALLYLYAGVDKAAEIYGYGEGESALRLISDVCSDMIDEPAEAAARFNEFCFVFFVQYTAADRLKSRVLEMEAALVERFRQAGKKYFLDLHTGVYRLTGADSDPLKALQYSEIAMHYALSHYLEYAVYDEFVEQETISGYAMEHEAIHGLMHQEFIMYLQPVVNLQTGEICGAEALARWENPNRGLLSPEKFLNVLKKKQLIGKMNMEIYRQGCRFLQKLGAEGKRMRLVFNFTVENVGTDDFAEQLHAVSRQYEVDPGQIVVQLNQMVEMSRSGIFVETIRRLRELGFDVCLAGLELDRVFFDYLDCRINGLKLRPELVRQIERREGYKVIEYVVKLCHELGLKVLCVGVENERQAELLKELGCEMASGFYYYYPVGQKEFAEIHIKPSLWT